MSLITGTTHNRACVRAGEICPVVQAWNDIFLSIHLSIHPIGLVDNAGQYASKKPLEELTIAIAVQ